MVKRRRALDILKVLEKYPKLNFTSLKKIVVKDLDMSPQTFVNALKEGVESGIITREEDHYKNRPIVWYSKPEFAKAENDYFQEFVSDLDSFKQRLELLKEQFPKFDILEKGEILFSFSDWLQVIGTRGGFGMGYFGSSKIGDLYQKSIFPLSLELVKLSLSVDRKQQRAIMNEYFLSWNDIEQENIEEIDRLLEIAIARKTK